MASKIQFVDTDPTGVVNDLVSKYESLTGKTLQPAQAERIIFNAIGYRLSLVLTAINETANQCLVDFAIGNALDALGALLGVVRLTPAPAQCTIRFNLVDGHGPLSIPTGIRVQSTDGQAVFITVETKSAAPTDAYLDIKAQCTLDGIVGNDYVAGNISIILDPQAFVTSAANLDTTANGSNAETDDEYRDRIKLAPSQFSVAGPKGAYEFFAKSANPNIIDVAVTIGHDPTSGDVIPGQVDIFPLMADGSDPTSEIIDDINAICNDEKIRPLTDTVVVKAPTKNNFSLSVQLVVLTDAVQSDILDLVNANLLAYTNKRKQKLGVDAVLTQIIGQCQVDGVYKVTIVSPGADVAAAENEFANCTGITVAITGTHDE